MTHSGFPRSTSSLLLKRGPYQIIPALPISTNLRRCSKIPHRASGRCILCRWILDRLHHLSFPRLPTTGEELGQDRPRKLRQSHRFFPMEWNLQFNHRFFDPMLTTTHGMAIKHRCQAKVDLERNLHARSLVR